MLSVRDNVDSISIGSGSVAAHDNSIAIGHSITTTKITDVAIGMTDKSVIRFYEDSINITSPKIIINGHMSIAAMEGRIIALEERIRELELVPLMEGGTEFRKKTQDLGKCIYLNTYLFVFWIGNDLSKYSIIRHRSCKLNLFGFTRYNHDQSWCGANAWFNPLHIRIDKTTTRILTY